ncbi:hypothetical protein GP2143_09650 [marine gamma proteobacterium HTCC2143]|uniref:Uncharacterized protein n=1 Tax=marine gamma proteobacterium HTCC2143 TaxID=247633 RepID=A0YFP6_9GAMM|nr:hypothetical protein GP2143_09650 [marine gamma proteobacterium HTCC2143]
MIKSKNIKESATMYLLKYFSFPLICLLFTFPVFAADPQLVNEENIITFIPATPAKAEEVNSTIQALITTINANSGALADVIDLLDRTTEPSSSIGSPGDPIEIQLLADHEITSNTFYNYFRYSAQQDERLLVHVQLVTPLSERQKSRCSSNSGTGTSPSSYDTQMHVYDANMNRIGGICGEDLDFKFPLSGTYILHFDYAAQSVGYFNAARIAAP